MFFPASWCPRCQRRSMPRLTSAECGKVVTWPSFFTIFTSSSSSSKRANAMQSANIRPLNGICSAMSFIQNHSKCILVYTYLHTGALIANVNTAFTRTNRRYVCVCIRYVDATIHCVRRREGIKQKSDKQWWIMYKVWCVVIFSAESFPFKK